MPQPVPSIFGTDAGTLTGSQTTAPASPSLPVVTPYTTTNRVNDWTNGLHRGSNIANGVNGAVQLGQLGWAGTRALGGMATRALSSAPAPVANATRAALSASPATWASLPGRAFAGAGRLAGNMVGLPEAAGMSAKTVIPGLKSLPGLGWAGATGKVLGRLNPLANAAYGAYALGDLGRSGHNLATGVENLDQVQNDSVGKSYLGNVLEASGRPGRSAIALGHGAAVAPIELANAHARAATLNMQVRDQQAGRQQINTQAFNSGSMTPQQHADHWARMRKLPLAEQTRIVQDSVKSRAAASLLRPPTTEPTRPSINPGF